MQVAAQRILAVTAAHFGLEVKVGSATDTSQNVG